MGYILPIQPFQAQQYANRLQMSNYNFAHVNAVLPIKMKSIFEDQMEEQSKKHEEEDESVSTSSHSFRQAVPYKGFIQPNPVNLSPEIAKVSGKGIQVNTYI
ncbi:MAG: hypothetical protein ABWX61_08425 [Paenisporosarcina sp.]